MSEEPTTPIKNDAFWDWLKQREEDLQYVMKVIAEFAKAQGEDVELPGPTDADAPPERREIGDRVGITVKPLSHADLRALSDGIADQIVKDKAWEWLKGFITGVTIGG
jgi:hypothetical protein